MKAKDKPKNQCFSKWHIISVAMDYGLSLHVSYVCYAGA